MEQILDQTSSVGRGKYITRLYSISPCQSILNWIWIVNVLSLVMLELMLISEASDISSCGAVCSCHADQHLVPTGMLHDLFPETFMQLSYQMPSRRRLIKLIALLIGIKLRQNLNILNQLGVNSIVENIKDVEFVAQDGLAAEDHRENKFFLATFIGMNNIHCWAMTLGLIIFDINEIAVHRVSRDFKSIEFGLCADSTKVNWCIRATAARRLNLNPLYGAS